MDREIVAGVLEEIGLLLELLGENPFKTRAYDNAARLVDLLDDRQQKILKMRFGLGYGEAMTLKRIGAELGLTRERVRQIQNEALARLLSAMTEGEPA